jgi:hypothetical protein
MFEKLITRICIALYIFMVLIYIFVPEARANSIYIDQVGTGNNDTAININQEGEDNTVNYSEGGTGNTITIDQKGDDAYVGYTTQWGSGAVWGGDLDGNDNNINIKQYCNQTFCGGDRFEFHIQGDRNDIDFYQGYRVYSDGSLDTVDDYEYGGHSVILDIHGSDNKFLGSQRSNNSGHEHSNTTYIYGNDNDVFAVQWGDQDKTINLTIYNNNNDVDIIQRDSSSHSATITLNGSYGTDLDLTQKGSTAQSYSLSQNCQTAGGCSVSVTQE